MATLNQKLKDLDKSMDKIVALMRTQNAPGMVVGFTDLVLRPAYALIITAQDAGTPIEDIDEALVATVSSVMFDYLQRIHPKEEERSAVDHFHLIGQDVSERVMEQIKLHFVKGKLLNAKGEKFDG